MNYRPTLSPVHAWQPPAPAEVQLPVSAPGPQMVVSGWRSAAQGWTNPPGGPRYSHELVAG